MCSYRSRTLGSVEPVSGYPEVRVRTVLSLPPSPCRRGRATSSSAVTSDLGSAAGYLQLSRRRLRGSYMAADS
ncbi:hypothetical protein MLD38_030920 [Melastoma candidum]|uniref:Uncharacterized protein n=1 Tax=Melastoma candidum TaxID=119954 RepID=A0ACB9MPN6_9MYRT|nr:hypothetical protein MLD38_030920 [Melastoma candidum]